MNDKKKIREILEGALARMDFGAHTDASAADRAATWKEVGNLLTAATDVADRLSESYEVAATAMLSAN